MNLLKLVIAAFSATNLMTTFSYLLSANYKKLFKEPVEKHYNIPPKVLLVSLLQLRVLRSGVTPPATS